MVVIPEGYEAFFVQVDVELRSQLSNALVLRPKGTDPDDIELTDYELERAVEQIIDNTMLDEYSTELAWVTPASPEHLRCYNFLSTAVD